MIGTGLIGGKSVGMILSQAILKRKDLLWKKKLEIHDSFFIGSDVFYTYLVVNKCWWIRRQFVKLEINREDVEKVQESMLKGKFTTYILQQFKEMLNYYGQNPIIVRSSSIQEDAFGNSFSGFSTVKLVLEKEVNLNKIGFS